MHEIDDATKSIEDILKNAGHFDSRTLPALSELFSSKKNS